MERKKDQVHILRTPIIHKRESTKHIQQATQMSGEETEDDGAPNQRRDFSAIDFALLRLLPPFEPLPSTGTPTTSSPAAVLFIGERGGHRLLLRFPARVGVSFEHGCAAMVSKEKGNGVTFVPEVLVPFCRRVGKEGRHSGNPEKGYRTSKNRECEELEGFSVSVLLVVRQAGKTLRKLSIEQSKAIPISNSEDEDENNNNNPPNNPPNNFMFREFTIRLLNMLTNPSRVLNIIAFSL
ncbi:hypothetical protein LXL04_032692 [Taraxacum kok-saghyz]